MSENEILLVDGIEYSLWLSKKEDELENSIKHHSKRIFGANSIYFDIKKKIKNSIGVGTIPDAYLIDFEKNAFYIIEIELSKHPEYDHINKQIGKFIGALNNYQARQKIARILKDYIEEDIIRKKFVINKIGNIELYQYFLENILEGVKDQNYHTIIVIDRVTDEISEACSILSPRPKIIEFRTFVRKNIGDLRVHCHLFKPLIPEPDISLPKISPPPTRKGYTGKEPERVKLFNETYVVKYWREVLILVAEELIQRNPKDFNSLADSEKMKGAKRNWLSKNGNLVYKPHQLSNGLFIDHNLNANSIYRKIRLFLSACGYKETDIKIYTKD